MKILILGATGFLGSRIYQVASENDSFTVVGTSRLINEQSTIIQVDVTNNESITHAIETIDPDVVVWSLMNFEEEMQLIDVGLKNVLSVIEGKTKFIFLSTDAVFVDGVGGYTENDSTGTLPKEAALANYVNGKYAGEHLVLTNHANHVILRTGPLYGNRDYLEKRTLNLIDKVKENQPIEAWENVYRTFVNVDDLARAVVELCEIEFNGVLHAGPLHKESYYTFFKKRLNQLGWDDGLLSPVEISQKAFPHLALDTSLDTQKAKGILQTNFRSM
ncbi:sugar nucleotide-binding protein [Alkalihalobacillus sp. CinArs1]|uniref:sugar nucleotide-binding protein n=1 Tax=Alkalihalobacillus sp. CinArs1 TaxID=2995314 RepID=UPI0022DE12D1|nr:sugar nucleotide-binding protein [Alkalihalobacillus sp. CinArs1]